MKYPIILFIFTLLFTVNRSFAADLDTYGGFTDIKGEKTGFFHTQKIDGRWWLITPEGHGFYGIGIAHPITGFTKGAITFTYGGNQELWLRDSIKKMRDLGYNCVWSGPYSPERLQFEYIDKPLAEKVFRESKIPYVFPLALLKHDVELEPGEKRPDVFSDDFLKRVNQHAEKYVTDLKDNPWVIGYYYGFAPWDREWVWINDLLSRENSPGRKHLITLLEQRYDGDVTQLNTIYGTDFDSFDSLKKRGNLNVPSWTKRYKNGFIPMPENPGSHEIFDDVQALFGEIVERMYKITYEAIKARDENHLIFGHYVKEATFTTEIWHRISPYIDVISPQHVSNVFPIRKIVRELDKPALISDQPFGNVYPLHLQGGNGAWGAVPDHVDRLVLYDILGERIAKDPDFIGIDFCAVLFDQSHADKPYERGQPGFFTMDGAAKDHLCRTVSTVNEEIMVHAKGSHDAKEVEDLDDEFHEIRHRYTQVMRDRREVLTKHPAIE